jgi:hypothetical protein
MSRRCQWCGEELQGRSDKKYCDDHCRSAGNKRKQAAREYSYRSIDRQLKTNRKILKYFNQAGKSIVRAQVLQEKGFDPRFFTHYWKSQKGQIYLFCYEFGFLKIKENKKEKYVLVHWQPYME